MLIILLNHSARLLVFLLSLHISTGLNAQPDSAVVISGQILPHPDIRPRLYLVQPLNFGQLYSSYEGRVLDSVDIQPDGHFEWRTTVPSEGVYFIFIQPKSGRFPNEIASPLRPENFIAVYLAPGARIRLDAQAVALAATYTLQEGYADNRLLAQLREFRRPWFAELDQFQPKKQEEEDPEQAVFFHGTPGERDMNRLLE